jgi:hypothetical protein
MVCLLIDSWLRSLGLETQNAGRGVARLEVEAWICSQELRQAPITADGATHHFQKS